MTFLKILLSPLSIESRDRRELSLVTELGVDACVMSKAESDGRSTGVENVQFIHPTTRPLGGWCPVAVNRVFSLFTWARTARRLHADVISGHDLPGLTVAWISTWFTRRKKRPLLVYDAHEFELGREQRSAIKSAAIRSYERFLMKRCAFSIVVNNGIADEMVKVHKLKQRPVVARNTPIYWQIDPDISTQMRTEMCRKLGVAEDTFITMYHGMLFPVRGVETLLEATARLTDTVTVLLGKGLDDYITALHERCENLGIADRVLFLDIVDSSELWKYVSAVDVGVLAVLPLVKNALFSLPNKLFENIQSLTPVVVSDMPEQSRLVKQYDIGLVFKAGDPDSLATAIDKLRRDRALYEKLKSNLHTAKNELCWENEKLMLKQSYIDVFAKAERQHKRCNTTE